MHRLDQATTGDHNLHLTQVKMVVLQFFENDITPEIDLIVNGAELFEFLRRVPSVIDIEQLKIIKDSNLCHLVLWIDNQNIEGHNSIIYGLHTSSVLSAHIK